MLGIGRIPLKRTRDNGEQEARREHGVPRKSKEKKEITVQDRVINPVKKTLLCTKCFCDTSTSKEECHV